MLAIRSWSSACALRYLASASYWYLWLSIIPTSWLGESNVPHISSPIDHVPVHIAWIDAPCVQHQHLLSVIYIDRESNRWKYDNKFCSALFCRVLELTRGLFEFPFENIQPVVLGLYILIPLEEGLLEHLVLGFCLFCAKNCSICLGAERGEFLFVSKGYSASPH
jgi:hypothetical protein